LIPGLDSEYPPTEAQARAAVAAGIGMWAGYLATRTQVGLANPWTALDFEVARIVNPEPIAFVSGWDDPALVRLLAATRRVKPCLDVEGGGLRPDGPWVQGWLDVCGCGLYGNIGVHNGRVAPFHIMAGYFGYDPKVIWPLNAARPQGMLGWQWYGGHNEFGANVDRSWLDDGFASTQGESVQAYFVVPDAGPSVGTVFLVSNLQMGPKRGIRSQEEFRLYAATMSDQKIYTIPQTVLANMPAEDEGLGPRLDALTAAVAAIPGGGGTPGPKTLTGTITGTVS
jgi:hypothetical protein